jgi:hypothetical protein
MAEHSVVTVSDPANDSEQDTRSSQTRITTGARKSRFLLGFFQPGEIRGYLEACGVAVASQDQAALDRDHAAAQAHASQLGGRAETSITPIGSHGHIDALRAEPTFAEHGANALSVDLVWVDIGHLVACQPRVDLDHVEQLRRAAPAVGDTDGLLRFCLPLQGSLPPPSTTPTFNPATNTYTWLSENPDFRLCGPAHGAQPDTGRSLMGFSIGPGLHQMNVVAFGGKYMLNNGYHRAVALLQAGHTRMPVIMVTVPSPVATPVTRVGMFSPQAVFGPNPPRIADFIASAAMDLPCKRMKLLFTVHAEVYPVPA